LTGAVQEASLRSVRDRDVVVRGLRLRVRERGEGAPCVLLHGWLDHLGSFDALAPLLPGRTIAYDARGHGDSSWVGPGGFYHFVDYVGDLEGLLAEVAPDGPVRIVGHSMGAAAALLYTACREERVAHLTMLDGAPLRIDAASVPDRMKKYLDDVAMDRTRRRVASQADARERLLRNNPGLSPQAVETLATVAADPAQGGALAWKWDPLLRAHSPLPVTEEVTQALVRGVRTPVLLLRAESGILPREEAVRARFAGLENLEVATIPGTRHHLHLEAPGAVAERILRAWGEAPRPDAG
jgi:pimeloyl-ACP methyl ester carboxylesterase